MTNAVNYWYQKYLAEKKKVAELEEQVKTAEDHAYFAGSENMREKLINKATEWIKGNIRDYISVPPYSTSADIDEDALIEDICKYMKG